MAEPRIGGFNGALAQVSALLAACPTWAALGGTDIITEERDALPPDTTHAFVSLGDADDFERINPESFFGAIPVLIDVLWPPYAGLSVADARIRANTDAWNLWRDLILASGAHVFASSPGIPIRLEKPADPAGWWTASMQLSLRVGVS